MSELEWKIQMMMKIFWMFQQKNKENEKLIFTLFPAIHLKDAGL